MASSKKLLIVFSRQCDQDTDTCDVHRHVIQFSEYSFGDHLSKFYGVGDEVLSIC